MNCYLVVLSNLFCLSACLLAQPTSSLSTVQQIDIQIETDNWRSILDSLRINGDETLPATITIDGQTYKNARVRYAFSSAFQPDAVRHSLHIEWSTSDQKQHQARLSNSLRDPSRLREIVAAEIIGQYMPVAEAKLAQVTINGDFYALLTRLEPIDQQFFLTHFQDGNGSHFQSNFRAKGSNPTACQTKAVTALTYEKDIFCYQEQFKGDENWRHLQALSFQLQQQPKLIHEQLSVDETLWMLALNNVLVHLDSYSGWGSRNYQLYVDKEGIFHPLHGKLNLAFGGYKNTGEGADLSVAELVKLDPMLHVFNEDKPLISQLLKNDRHRKVYIAHMRTILEDFFWTDRFADRVTELYELIAPILQENNYDLTRFNKSLLSTTGKRSQIPGLLQLMEDRAAFLKKHPIMTVLPSTVGEISFRKRAPYSSEKIATFDIQIPIDRFPKKVFLYYRFDEKAPFQSIELNDEGKNGDTTANDDIYGITVSPRSDTLEYYIFVENAGAVTFEPSHYLVKRHVQSLKALNN